MGYDERRRFMVRRLRELGFGITVAPTPGIDFGVNAEGYLRFSYANSLEMIAAAMDRLGAYLQAR